ncbi:MAG TPA: FG-GAP-like repeat-containing protein, partial [Acidobacteriaceae bacterium]|nr:FG-GAP-like repeat-containing protein [Acidobacteriaceae bacterium]
MHVGRFVSVPLLFFAVLAQGQSNPVPFLNQTLLPVGTAPGGPTLTLTVNGTGFASSSVVNWNGIPLQTTFVSGSQLTATISAADIANPGTATIDVTTPGPGGGTSNFAFFPVSAVTTPSFTYYSIDNPPSAATNILQSPVAVDVNGDGKLDVIAGYFDQMAVLLGKGDGSFQPAQFVNLGGSGNEQLQAIVSVGDFNGDGKLDVAIADAATNLVSVLLGNGDGTFQSASNLAVENGYVVNLTAVGDFNKDGKLDLLTGNNPGLLSPNSNPMFSVFLGNGDGTFQDPVNSQVGTPIQTMAVGDLNGDGKLDVVASSLVFLGNGDGTFGAPLGNQVMGGVLQDVNGDGKLDLLAAANGNLYVSLGNGDGTFLPAVSYNASAGSPISLTVGDFNADGKLDVAASGPQAISILYGNGDGTFQPGMTYPSALNGGGFIDGDFNGDGKLDLFASPNTSNLLGTVFLQGSFPLLSPAPASLTFAQQAIGTTSAAQDVVFTNSGRATLNISGISISGANSGDYAESGNCGATLAANASCQIAVTFTPTAPGTRNAALSVIDNAPGSPQTVSLTGSTPPAPILTLSPASITFPSQYVGTSGLPQAVTVTNAGNAVLTITSVTTSS